MKASGYGYSSIIEALNGQGFRTKRGKTFCTNSIHDILVNEKYTGTFFITVALIGTTITKVTPRIK
jgi:site-specific DNA recombinase